MPDKAHTALVGHRVRQSRLTAGVSLRALARQIGVSAATLSAIETGKTGLTVTRLQEIAATLRVSPDRLLGCIDDAATAQPSAHLFDTRQPDADGPDWRVFKPLSIDPVLAAAIIAFVGTGYHGATMRSIARQVGMSVPGLYHHYTSKQELLVTVLDLGMADLTWRMRAADREGQHSVDRVRLMVEALALFHTHRRELALIGASEMRSLEPANRRRIAGLRNDVQHLLDSAIDQAVTAGRMRTTSARHAGRAIATMCTSLPQWFRADGPASPERIAAEYAQFALGLLGHHSLDPSEQR